MHALCSTAAVSGKVATALLVTATTPMSFCSSYSLAKVQKCSTATMPRNLCMPSAALLISVARWQQPCLSLQVPLGDFAVHTALQNCRSDAQQPCPETCAYPLQHCSTTPMSRCSSTALQNCRSAAQQPRLKTCACPLQHCCCQ